MDYSSVFKSEYNTLREKAKQSKYIISSTNPAIKDIGTMRVDSSGTLEIRIRDRDAFDYDRLLQHIKDTSVRPDGRTVKMLKKLIPGFSEIYSNAWNVGPGEINSYAVKFPRNKLHRVSTREYGGSKGKTEGITYWTVLFNFLGGTNICDVERFSGSHILRDAGPANYEIRFSNLIFKSSKYIPEFMDLFFGENKIE